MKCQSCGRQSESTFCKDCANDAGDLKRFDEVAENLTSYYVETQGFDREVAKSVAIGVLSHQLAWEKKFLRSEKRRGIASKAVVATVAIVFAMIGIGLGWYMKMANGSVYYFNTNGDKTDLFSDVELSNNHDIDFYEINYPADQKLVSVDGNFVTFRSLVGGFFSPRYDYYTFNINDESGSKIDPDSSFFKTMAMAKPNGFVYTEKADGNKVAWQYRSDSGEISNIDGSYISKSRNHVLTRDPKRLIATNLVTGKADLEIAVSDEELIASISDNFVAYLDRNLNKIKLVGFDGKKLEFKVKFKPTSIISNDRYAFVESWGNVSFETLTCYDFVTGESRITEKGNLTSVQLSRGNTPEDTVISWGYLDRQSPESKEYTRGIRYVRMSEPDKKVSLFASKNSVNYIIPLAVTKDYMLWDARDPWRTNTRDKWIGDAVQSYGLKFYDFVDGREMVLESSNCDNVAVDGWNAAWEVYRGDRNKEFFNVKFANLEQTNKYYNDIAKKQTVDEIFGNITTKRIDDIETSEIHAKFDQYLNYGSINTNLTQADNYAIVGSQENTEYFLFNPSVKLAARFDEDSENLRKILGNRKFSWKKYGDNYDSYDGFDVVSEKTYDPATGKFTDGFTPARQISYDVEHEGGLYNLYLINGQSRKEIYSTNSYYSCVMIAESEKQSWIVFAANDEDENVSLHVYDINKGADVKLFDAPESDLQGLFVDRNRVFYKLSGDRFQTVYDMTTGEKSRIQLDSEETIFSQLQLMGTKNPVITCKIGDSILLGTPSQLLESGMKGFARISIGDKTPLAVIGDDLVLANASKQKVDAPVYDELLVINLKTGKRTMLDSKNITEINALGDYLFWSADRGRKNLEFRNICFARLK